MTNRFVSIIFPMILIILWAFLSTYRIVDPIFLPEPWAVVRSIFIGVYSGRMIWDLLATIGRALTGFVLAASFGVPLGLLIGRIPFLAKATQPTIDFFRSIPATALFPLFLFVFGVGDESKIAIVIYACSLIVLVNTAYGALQVKRPRILSAQVMGATRWQIFWKIIVPESAPGIFAGLRVALSLSFVLIVVTEMFIGTKLGLGYRINEAYEVYRITDMYAAIVLTGIVGYLANLSLIRFEKKSLHWVGQ